MNQQLLNYFVILFICCSFNSLVHSLYDPKNSNVIELTETNFNHKVILSDEIWLVEFYAPWCGHCQAFVPEYSKAAAALKGIVKVGAVNADEYKELAGRYGIQGFPTIKIFGLDKNRPEEFKGSRSAQGLVDAVFQTLRSKVDQHLYGKQSDKSYKSQSDPKDVIELNDANFDDLVLDSNDMWLVEFFAPWCGHCKNLAPHWAEAATSLKGKVKLGALDATVNTVKAQFYGVKGYPTIKFFGMNKQERPEDYDGGRTASDIVNWALDKITENMPGPEIQELTHQKIFVDFCWNHSLCIIAVLPHILDCQTQCRQNYLHMLNKVGDKNKRRMWGWVWSEATSQSKLENALEIGGFGYPALVVVNPKKMKFSTFKGSFSYEGISEFLRDLSYGRGYSVSLKDDNIPEVSTIEPWDGKDGVLEVQDDIDLSDVELDPLDVDASSHKEEL